MSKVLEHPALSPAAAAAHFREALALETDPADVHADLESGAADFVVLDARTPETFARGHVPGAINIPHRRIDAKSTAGLSRDQLIVTYCDGIGCNASTRAAGKLAALGFTVKEMLGGLDWWQRDGYAIEIGSAAGEAAVNAAGEAANVACGC